MQVLHFTPGCQDSDEFQKQGTVAIMPLAASSGDSEISCLLPRAWSQHRGAGSEPMHSCIWPSMDKLPALFDHSLRIENLGAGYLSIDGQIQLA